VNIKVAEGEQMEASIEDIMPPDWQIYGYSITTFDPALLAIYIAAKELFPGVWVNCKDGRRVNNWCGLRSPACAIGAKYSAHKLGKALDLHCEDLKGLREWCTSEAGLAAGIKRVEVCAATPTWVHIDTLEPNIKNWNDKTQPYVFLP
jgi:hypothetical protein